MGIIRPKLQGTTLYLTSLMLLMSLYRAEGILNRGNVDAFSLEESQNLSIFFATNNSVTTHLKKQLEEVTYSSCTHSVYFRTGGSKSPET